MGYLKPHEETLVEIFQRRNVVIHNDGAVHGSYIAKVAAHLRKDTKVGQSLDVDPVYLQNAIDVAELCFILIGAELWKQLDGQDQQRATLLVKIGFDGLNSERWGLSKGINFFIMNDKG